MEWWPGTLADWAVVLSGIATATIILAVTVRRQLSVMENETASRLRPWIIPVKIFPELVTLEDGTTWEYDEIMTKMEKDPTIHPDIIHFKMSFINCGTIPAKISFALIDQKEKFSRDAFKNESMSDSVTMVPNYDYGRHVAVPHKELLHGWKYYAGISIEYTAGKKKFQSGAIYEITSNSSALLEDWHEKV